MKLAVFGGTEDHAESEWEQLKQKYKDDIIETGGIDLKECDFNALKSMFEGLPFDVIGAEVEKLAPSLKLRLDILKLLWKFSPGNKRQPLHVGDKVTWLRADDEIPWGLEGAVCGFDGSGDVKVSFRASRDEAASTWILSAAELKRTKDIREKNQAKRSSTVVGIVDEMTGDKKTGSLWIESIPLVNLIYDAFFDDIPVFQNVKETVNALTLISALGLTIATATPGAFEAEEFDAFLAKFEDGGQYECFRLNDGRDVGTYFYDYFIYDSVNALSFSAGSLSAFLLFILSAASAEFSDMDPKVFEVWWRYSRWLVLGGAVALVYSMIKTCHAFMDLYTIKFPDYVLVEGGECTIKTGMLGRPIWPYSFASVDSQWAYIWGNMGFVLNVCTWGSLVLISLSARAKYRAQRRLPDWPCLHGRWSLFKKHGICAVCADCCKKGFIPPLDAWDENEPSNCHNGNQAAKENQVRPVLGLEPAQTGDL